MKHIADQKQHENVAEYILFMYQMEDVIRAYQFDLDNIIEGFVRPQLADEAYLPENREWFQGLIRSMKGQRLEKSGHMLQVQEVIMEISYLHNTLINIQSDHKYKDLFAAASPFIDEFKEKSNLKDKNHIEIAFHALYMKLLLRLQKKEISAESEEAFDQMRILLAYLSRTYKQMKEGNMDFLNN